MTSNMKELTENFLLDPDVQLAMDWGKEQNVFGILEIGETVHSKMLAWLLNPREGHLQGDYFIKALLRECLKNKKANNIQTDLGYPIDNFSFNNSIVRTEVQINKNRKNKIDIAVIDPDSNIAIFIENKFGSSENYNKAKDCYQTEIYYDGFKNKYEGYEKFFIFMDFRGKKAQDKDHWFNVDYSWLIKALNNRLGREMLPTHLELLFLEYHNYIAEDMETTYFTRAYKLLPKVAQKHKILIEKVKESRKKNGLYKKCNLHNFLAEYSNDQGKYLYSPKYLYLRFDIFFDSLFKYGEFENFTTQIEAKLGAELYIDYAANGFDFANEEWYKLGSNIKHTFMFINVIKQKIKQKIDNDESNENEEKLYLVEIVIDPDCIQKKLKGKLYKLLENNGIDIENIDGALIYSKKEDIKDSEVINTACSSYQYANKLYQKLNRLK